MTLRLVSIFLLAILFVLPAQLAAFITQNTGCHHNGTWYADKSVVPSMEKCLNCQCNRKTLVCRLKVCPEMPMPPPRGCVVVQKKNTCCPYLSCARLDAFYKIPTKRRIIAYLDHYERESIDRVVNDNMLQRRSDDSDVDLFVCVKNGTVYKSGSAMSSSNLCSYCYCIGGTEKCVKPKCMLPVEGCKPIFVDSTCCPVRYDCSSKTSGKSSQEVRYRKTSNKHFQRMSQRLQRNRGCTVGSQFYAEGQKMRSDADKPCDICFCIRGTRRCAPKKCSPALKNCIPVVPKGQCCPSSYDCGSQRDYRRSQSSRQFNLYSLLFGKEEQEAEATAAAATMPQNAMAEHYPLDRHPTEPPVGDALQASSEKSILDTLREGLEFIDSNNNQVLASNMDLVKAATPTPTTEVGVATELSSTTELSFLDLLLGPSTENEIKVMPDTTTVKKPLSWVDLLLGPDEEEPMQASSMVTESFVDASTALTQPEAEPPMTTTTLSSIKRLADDFDDQLNSDEIAVGELPAEAQQIVLSNSENWAGSKQLNNKPLHNRINSKLANLTVTPPMVVVTSKYGQPVTYRTPKPTTTTMVKPTTTTIKPKPKPKTTRRTTTPTPQPTTTITTTTTTSTTTAKPTTTTIRTTVRPSFKPKQPPHIVSSVKPLIIKTNPSILEAEPLDDNDSTAPTLPPSLPNLKIIPFLPTDAVNTAPKLPSQSSYSNPNNYYQQPIASDKMDIDYDASYDETAAHYPSIASAFPQQQPQQHHPNDNNNKNNNDQAAYKYKFNIEVPAVEPPPEPVVHLGGQYEGSADYVKYDFDQQVVPPAHSGFSPPTETEGGFMPKEPLVIDGEVLQDHVTTNVILAIGDNYHVTQHVIDITTESRDNDTSAIEITTPDPFKDVIHTEKSPNLDTLIVDKQHKKPTQQLEQDQQLQQEQQQHLQHIESVSYSIRNSSGDKATAAATATIMTTAEPITTKTPAITTTKQTPLIDKLEINKLDQLLDELLGSAIHSSSTVPPFRTLPPGKAATSAITTAATATTTTTVRPTMTTRANKKGNKTKNKPAAGNRRNNPTAATSKPIRFKVQQATRRTPASSGNNSPNNSHINYRNNSVATAALTSVKGKGTTATTIPTTIAKPTTVAATTAATTTSTTKATTTTTASITMRPFLMSPFDKLPFMNASYEVRPHMLQPQQQQLLELQQRPQQFHHYQHAPSSSTTTTTRTTSAPIAAAADASSIGGGGGGVGGVVGGDSLMDHTGILKLAGCNIYGRMYRVGRIIIELSNQCLECKCTEVGVKCGPLDC
ncbi:mucin-5AC [Drosophila innubila]|uniref:mucin-5AC n=1 Tax=Drosophila innubila TaxID=198719 RepID=UPI00148E5EF1|nr:mucin-5AC [Drosophila innubila]